MSIGSTLRGLLCAGLIGAANVPCPLTAAETQVKESPLVAKARAASEAGRFNEALSLATEAIAADPADKNAFYLRARVYEVKRQTEEAIKDYTTVLNMDGKATGVYQRRAYQYALLAKYEEAIKDYDSFIDQAGERTPWKTYVDRGDLELRIGRIAPSILDFNKAIAMNPQYEAYCWERGIAYYYAGRYEEGARQFRLHNAISPDDVENAAWHYLCIARLEGPDKARAKLLNVKQDGRVPLMEVQALLGGKAKPEDVLRACLEAKGTPEELKRHLFYGHAYLGLYYEAQGDKDKAREHILKAANEYRIDNYMGDIANVHATRLQAADAKGK